MLNTDYHNLQPVFIIKPGNISEKDAKMPNDVKKTAETRKRDALGDRLKSSYENRTRILLPRRTYTVIRIDGKSFHSYTRGCRRPFDENLMADMDSTAATLCDQIAGARLAYVQSDEISLLLTDFASPQSEAWFDGNIQKITSISASIATAHFNKVRGARGINKIALFDSRVFTIPDSMEVENYFVWRQQDATRNSISMTAQAHIPHKDLQGKGCDEMQEMLFQRAGVNRNDMPAGFKRGRCAVRTVTEKDIEYTDRRTGETALVEGFLRTSWEIVVPPIFPQDRQWLRARIPRPASES